MVPASDYGGIETLDAVAGAGLPDYGAWVAKCQAFKAAHPILQPAQLGDPINSYHLVQRLERHTSATHIFVSDTGGAYYTTGQALSFDRGQRELTSVAFANMGIALPLAIGAAAGDPSADIICLSGDGSLEVNMQELHTIVQYDLPIKIFAESFQVNFNRIQHIAHFPKRLLVHETAAHENASDVYLLCRTCYVR